MITPHAVAAARCAGTWQQKWQCGWKQPVSPALPRAGYDFGHSLLPALVVLLAVVLVVRFARKRKKGRSAAPAGAGR
jgi:hypothetical protein